MLVTATLPISGVVGGDVAETSGGASGPGSKGPEGSKVVEGDVPGTSHGHKKHSGSGSKVPLSGSSKTGGSSKKTAGGGSSKTGSVKDTKKVRK